MRISISGAHQVTQANTAPAAMENRSAMPMTRSMVTLSPLPQYWAVSMLAPEISP